jgi:hypothetical protein
VEWLHIGSQGSIEGCCGKEEEEEEEAYWCKI